MWWRALEEHIDRRTMAATKPIRSDDSRPTVKIFAGNANPALAQEICEALGHANWATAWCKQFSDGEIYLQIQENVRGARCFRDPADLHARWIAT